MKQYNQAEFFVSASEYEGFGLTAIEAMASGLIPLLNDIESFRDFVEQEGNGFILDFSSPEKAGAGIEKALRLKASERKEMASKARLSVNRFDWPAKVKEFAAVYRGCLEGKK